MSSLDILGGKCNKTERGYSQTEVSMFEQAVCLLQLQSPLLLWLQYVCSQAPALTNTCDHSPVRAFCGVEQPLPSVMVSTSHHLLAAGLMFEELCLLLEHPSSNLQEPKDHLSSTGMWDQANALCRLFTEIRRE